MTSPVFEDAVGKVYHGDFRNIMNDLEFDFIFTDPPYNVGYKYPNYPDKLPAKEYQALFTHFKGHKTMILHYPEDICNIVAPAIGKVDKMIEWCYNNHLSSKAHRSIAFFNCKPDFKKVKQPYKNPNDKRIQKIISEGSTGSRSYDWMCDIQQVKNVSKDKNANFTNQIPIELLKRIILMTTEEGQTILDPFSGSGSLYFACRETNRKYIGIEQSEQHIAVFNERLYKWIQERE
tara:strand:+ start:239 stop:940 length:702 start_codon:yes stop_codon:yes gene_type:complete